MMNAHFFYALPPLLVCSKNTGCGSKNLKALRVHGPGAVMWRLNVKKKRKKDMVKGKIVKREIFTIIRSAKSY